MAETAPVSGIGVGTMLAETYQVTGLLGRGGMGAVWLAEHTRLPGKKVAVKVLHPEVAQDNEALARFRREAEIASRLGHPNIVDVHDFNILPDGSPYLILEFLDGEDLAARLERGALPLDEVISIIRQVGSGLQAAHRQNVVHRDLKPQNVFLVPTEAGGVISLQAKLLDFGISKIRGSNTVKTNASSMLGTPQYMAPEQATGRHDDVDGRTDVFALGAMVYEMLSATPAFPGQTIPEVVFKVVYEDPKPLSELVNVPPGVSDAVHKALSKEQADRFQDVSDFIRALTGSPLDTLQRGAVIARESGTNSAVSSGGPTAAGVSSGIPSPGASGDAKTISASDAELALSGTVASSTAPASDSVKSALAATVDSSKLPLTASKSAARGAAGKPWIRYAIVALLAAGAAGAAVLVMSKKSGDEPAAEATLSSNLSSNLSSDAAAAPKSVNAIDAGPALATASDASSSSMAATSDAAPAVVLPDARGQMGARDRRDPKRDARKRAKKVLPPIVAASLTRAENLLRAGKAERARIVAQRTLQNVPSDRAYSIMARAYCALHDQGMAQTAMRSVRKRRSKRRVVAACRKAGVDL